MRKRPEGDEGFALLAVMGGMLALTLVVLATLAYVVNSLPVSRRGQDSAGAIQAAQAGVDDYLGRLATCDSYWVNRCGGDAPAALTGWAAVGASTQGEYHYQLVSDPGSGGEAGLLRLRSTGRIDVGDEDVERTLVVDLRKRSLLDYVYYTDKESTSPDSVVRRYPPRTVKVDPPQSGYNAFRYGGISASEADKCARYHYATSTSAKRDGANPTETWEISNNGGATWINYGTRAISCDIQFASIDVIDGPVYTQDAILLDNPQFKQPVSTRWPAGSTPAPNASAWYRVVAGGSGPKAGYVPMYDSEDVKLPPSNATIKARTDPLIGDGVKGCPYTGPTRIVLKGNGTMDVTSPLTRSTNPKCTTGAPTSPGLDVTQNVKIPENGVIYVSASTESCSGKALGTYPIDGDVTPYSCFAGDVFIQGTLSGRLTVASADDIVVTEDVVYNDASADSLGLIADGDVEVYHPVKCSTTVVAPFTCDDFTNSLSTLNNITISAAIFSVQQSFTVQNFDRGDKLGTLTMTGGIYQKYRGPVGTGGAGGTGYAKDYRYDGRLKSLPPPSFLDPIAAPWASKGVAEVKNPAGLPQ